MAQIASKAQLLGGELGQVKPVVRPLHPALVNQQVLQHYHVIRTRVMFIPSLLEQDDSINIYTVETLPDDRKRLIMQYLDNPSGKHDRKSRVYATKYIMYHNELYQKSEDGLLLLCLSPDEAT